MNKISEIRNYIINHKLSTIALCIPSGKLCFNWILACYYTNIRVIVFDVYNLCNVQLQCKLLRITHIVTTNNFAKTLKDIKIILIDDISKDYISNNCKKDKNKLFIDKKIDDKKIWYTLITNKSITNLYKHHTDSEFEYNKKYTKIRGDTCVIVYPVYSLFMIPIIILYKHYKKRIYFYNELNKIRTFSHIALLPNDPIANQLKAKYIQYIIDISSPTYKLDIKNAWYYSGIHGQYIAMHRSRKYIKLLPNCKIADELPNLQYKQQHIYVLQRPIKILVNNNQSTNNKSINNKSKYYTIDHYSNHYFKSHRTKQVKLAIFCFMHQYPFLQKPIIENIYFISKSIIIEYLRKINRPIFIFHYMDDMTFTIYIQYNSVYYNIFSNAIKSITAIYNRIIQHRNIYITQIPPENTPQFKQSLDSINIINIPSIMRYIIYVIFEIIFKYSVKFVQTYIYTLESSIKSKPSRESYQLEQYYIDFCIEHYVPVHIPIILLISCIAHQESIKNLIFIEIEGTRLLYPMRKVPVDRESLLNLIYEFESIWNSKSLLNYIKPLYSQVHVTDEYQTNIRYFGNTRPPIQYDIYSKSTTLYIMNGILTKDGHGDSGYLSSIIKKIITE